MVQEKHVFLSESFFQEKTGSTLELYQKDCAKNHNIVIT